MKQGVEAACLLARPPIVQIAPCDGGYHERDILVACPQTIRGETEFEWEDGRPVAVLENESLTRIVAEDLSWPGGTASAPSMFRVISDDVVIEQLDLVGGGLTWSFWTLLIDVGGFPGGAACPTDGPLEGVVVRRVGLSNAGQGIQSVNAHVRVESVLTIGNVIGSTLFSGEDVHTRITGSTYQSNTWYGICTFATEVPFNPRCPPDASDPPEVRHTATLIGNDISFNGEAIDAGAGVRHITLAASATMPQVDRALDTYLAFNLLENNRNYGTIIDFPIYQVGRLSSSFEVNSTQLLNRYSGNGRNDVFVGFTLVGRSLDPDGVVATNFGAVPLVEHPELYALDSHVSLWAVPQPSVDYDHPGQLGSDGALVHTPGHLGPTAPTNSIRLNGQLLPFGTSISPPPPVP